MVIFNDLGGPTVNTLRSVSGGKLVMVRLLWVVFRGSSNALVVMVHGIKWFETR